MGKAGRWIKNLLTGKKEEKNSNKKDNLDVSSSQILVASTVTGANIMPTAPLQRRWWSFGRSVNSEKTAGHKSCRSFDSIIASQLVSQALLEYAILQQQNHAAAAVVPPLEVTSKTDHQPPGPVEHAAATKIQASFRSHLAQKALRALKGLVKIQALVRGHLVRKQTTAMVRGMNALMTIQVRARFQRIQMAEESQSSQHTNYMGRRSNASQRGLFLAQESQPSVTHVDQEKEVDIDKAEAHMSNPQTPHREQSSLNASYPRRLSISKRVHHSHPSDSSPSTPASSTRYYDRQVEELSLNRAAQMSSQQGEPNYMTRTESSRAKVRSQSEPKQRPVKLKSKSRRTASNEGLPAVMQEVQTPGSSSTDVHQKNQNRWLIKLHRSSKSNKDIESDSSYCRTLHAYEPAVDLY